MCRARPKTADPPLFPHPLGPTIPINPPTDWLRREKTTHSGTHRRGDLHSLPPTPPVSAILLPPRRPISTGRVIYIPLLRLDLPPLFLEFGHELLPTLIELLLALAEALLLLADLLHKGLTHLFFLAQHLLRERGLGVLDARLVLFVAR